MASSQQRSKYEAALSRAHRALFWAERAAGEAGDEGAAEDCTALQAELSRLMSDSISGKKRPRRQLTTLDSDCA